MIQSIPFLVALAVLAPAAGDEQIFDLNQAVDEQLMSLNPYLTRNNLGLMELHSDWRRGILISPGYLLGVDSLERAGDCFFQKNGTTLHFSFLLRFKLLLFAAAKVQSDNQPPVSMYMRPTENVLALNLTVTDYEAPSCRVSLDSLAFIRLGQIALETSQPVTDDYKAALQEFALPFLNAKLEEKKKELLPHFQIFCE